MRVPDLRYAYVDIPGGRDEPPTYYCSECGQYRGLHLKNCDVGRFEAEAREDDDPPEPGATGA